MDDSLYARLGGFKGISAIAGAAVDHHLRNPEVATRFRNLDVPKAKKLATQFFCAGSGGPEAYEGRDMRTTHLGMNINEREYMAVMDDILRAVDEHKVGPRERAEVVAILYSLKGEILRV
jgi:hemoglobin